MLVTTQKYNVGDIVAFKLSNGDEVVAKVIDDNDTAYVIDTPCTVMPSPQGLGLIQSIFSAEKDVKVTLNKQHVMMSAPVINQMQSHYIQTTTGIQTVPKGIIT